MVAHTIAHNRHRHRCDSVATASVDTKTFIRTINVSVVRVRRRRLLRSVSAWGWSGRVGRAQGGGRSLWYSLGFSGLVICVAVVAAAAVIDCGEWKCCSRR